MDIDLEKLEDNIAFSNMSTEDKKTLIDILKGQKTHFVPKVGDCVTVKVKGREGDNPYHYRQTNLFLVTDVNETHVVCEFLTYDEGRVEAWSFSEHIFFPANEAHEAMKRPTTEKIMQGALGEPWAGPCIGFEAGEFVLFAGNSLGEGEVLARSSSWRRFVDLVSEYHSDYVEEDT